MKQAMLTAQGLATSKAQSGDFDEANAQLDTAIKLAEQLLGSSGSPHRVEYYKELDVAKAQLAAAVEVKPTRTFVKKAKDSFNEIHSEMKEAENDGDFEEARQCLSLAQTRAYFVLQTVEQSNAYDRDLEVFKPRISEATMVDANLPTVKELQEELDELLNGADKSIDTDAKVARQGLRNALKTANRILAVKEHTKTQKDRHGTLKSFLGKVKDTYIPEGMSKNLSDEGGLRDDGGRFDVFLAALSILEKDKKQENVTRVVNTANAYLTLVYDKLDEEKQKDPTVQRRKKVCETTLKQMKHMKLALDFEALGTPPWDEETEDTAADLYTKVLFEDGDVATSKASGGVFGAVWLKSMDWEEDKEKRNFIFKKADAPVAIPGFPHKGEAPREVLGDLVGKELKALTGMDFSVPETRIIGIDPGKLAGSTGKDEIMGSAQQVVPTVGDIGDLYEENPQMLEKISPEETQKMAMFDMIALNMDRHQSNFMVTEPGEDGSCKMVPIDNGLAFPTRQGFDNRRGKAATGSALTWLPQAHEKFGKEVLAAIDSLDADEIINAMKQRVNSLDEQHPELNVKDTVPDETFDLTRRSILFMKAAAKRLSPIAMQEALMLNSTTIFDCPTKEMDQRFEEIIAKAEENMEAYSPLSKMTWDEKKLFYLVHYELAWNSTFNDPTWGTSVFAWDLWGRQYPRQALSIHAKETPVPGVKQTMKKQLDEIEQADPSSKLREKVSKKTLREASEWVGREWAKLGKVKEAAERKKKEEELIKDFTRTFPKETFPSEDPERANYLVAYEQFLRWGGKEQTKIKGKKITSKTRFAVRYTAIKEQCLELDKEAEREREESEKNEREQLLDSPAYKKYVAMFQSALNETPDWSTSRLEDVKALMERWNEFEQLGGYQAFCDCGGDSETLGDTLKDAIRFLKDHKQARTLSVD